MRTTLRNYRVAIGMSTAFVKARSPNNAFRIAVRTLIKVRRIKRQPPTDEEGGWKGTSISIA